MVPSLKLLVTATFAGSTLADSLAGGCWRDTVCTGPAEASFPGPWDANIFAPATRNPSPQRILSFETHEPIGSFPGNATLRGNGSALVFDFGVETGGVISVDYRLTGDHATLGLAFTEAKDYIGYSSDSSNGNYRGPGATLISQDGAWTAALEPGSGTYELPVERLRAGFRYLTLFILTNGTTTLDIDDVRVEIVYQPTWANLRAFQGYFHSSAADLNRFWYAGAHTLQTVASPPNAGRVTTSTITHGGWLNNQTIGVGYSVMLDGAKRDRWVWPGDTGVEVPSAFYSTGDLESTRNALQTAYNYQNSAGSLPNSGPPSAGHKSDTYHMWAMISTYNYVLFSGDMDFLNSNWAGYLRAMDYILALVESDGLLNVKNNGDWARYVNVNNGSEPNVILYHTLNTGASLAQWAPPDSTNGTNLTVTWLSRAETLRTNIFKHFWDADKGAFFDGYLNKDLYPQDTNSIALAFGVAQPGTPEAAAISSQLTQNWTPIGPASPELPGNVSPYISSIELEAHFAAGRPDRALRLMRDLWGWYLGHPNGTGSSVPEGYLVDGTWGYRSTRGYTNDPAYVSHAHGWSTGPTSTLTNYLVGLRVTQPAGAQWALKPAFGLVRHAEAGFTTKLGKFSAKYSVCGRTTRVEWDAPVGTRGWLDLGTEKKWVDGGKGKITVTVAVPAS